MAEHLNDPDADLEEAHARDGLIYELSVALMRLDGNDGDPHQLVWEGGPIPEPWGDVWQRYEPDAERVLDAIGEGSARALVDLRSTLTNVQRVLEAAGHDGNDDDAACKALRLIAALGLERVESTPPNDPANGEPMFREASRDCTYCHGHCPSPEGCERAERLAAGVDGKSPEQLRQELLSGQWDLSKAAEKPAVVLVDARVLAENLYHIAMYGDRGNGEKLMDAIGAAIVTAGVKGKEEPHA